MPTTQPWHNRLPSLSELREEVEICLLSTRMADSANKLLVHDAPSDAMTRNTKDVIEETYRRVREYLPSIIRNTPGLNPPVNNGGDRISYLHDFAEWAVMAEKAGPSPRSTSKPLKGKALKAAQFIREKPVGEVVSAKQIAIHIGDDYTEASVRNHLAPKLKLHGFRSHEGPDGGYSAPVS